MLRRFVPKRKRKEENKTDMQYRSVFNITKGINKKDLPVAMQDFYLRNAQNVYFEEGKIKHRKGYSKFNTETPLAGDPVMKIKEFYKYSGITYTCAFTTKNAYVLNTITNKWDLNTENEVVVDCETNWAAKSGVACALESTIKRYGSNSEKITIDSGKTGLCASIDFGAKDLTGYTHLYFYIRSTKILTAGQFQLLLDNTAACASPLETLDIPAMPEAVTWYEFCVPLAVPASLGAIISVGLNAVDDLLGISLYIDNIVAVNCFTGSQLNKIQTEQIFDQTSGETYFIFSNGIDNIKYWTGTGNWADLSGSPNKAKRIINFEHYLMLLNTNVGGSWSPQRVEWPQLGKPTVWTGEDSGNNSLAGTPDFIEACSHLRAALVIFKKESIAMCSYVGGINPFEFEEGKVKNIGCSAEGSVQNIGERIIFLGWDNVYTFDGFVAESIGDNVVIELMEQINPELLDLIHSHIMKELNIYLLFIPSLTASYPDQCWVYNYIEKTWTFFKFYDNFTSSGFVLSTGSPKTIGELTQKIRALNFRIGSQALIDLDTISLFGSSDGYIYKYDKTIFNDNLHAIDAFVDSKSYIFGDVNLYNHLCQIALFGKGNTISVYVSINDGVSFSLIGTISQSTSTELANFLRKIDKVGERFMVRFKNDTVDEWFEISGWQLGYIEKTRVV